MKKCAMLFLALILGLSLCSCGKNDVQEEWPVSGLGAILPAPDSRNISIGYELQSSFSADIEKAQKEDFSAYVVKCEDAGFIIDPESDSNEYTAYNQDGYKVHISYYSGLKSVSIILDAPKVNGTFVWPSIGFATYLPTPDTNVGTISIDTSKQFNAWIGETTYDDYRNYVNGCIENGFDVDYSNYEKVYTAKNQDGVSLRLEYQGFDTMYIAVYAPNDIEPEETDPPVYETEATEDTSEHEEIDEENKTELVDGMRPEFKDALDSYEAFFQEYCDFMKKYSKNPSDLTLLLDYAQYMSQYGEMMSKLDELENGEMNDAETKYYAKVTARITKMLLEVSESI